MTLCECGCREEVKKGNRFIQGHYARMHNPMKNPKTVKKNIESRKEHLNDPITKPALCECGCGEYAKSGNRFIQGHNHRRKDKDSAPICRVCSTLLNDDNWTPSGKQFDNRICKICSAEQRRQHWLMNIDKSREYVRLRAYSTRDTLPMDKNRDCSLFLGVHVAEGVLCEMFKDVIRMPHGNPGYDFICNNGYLIDSKASCKHVYNNRSTRWMFRIRKNTIADYFILIAFDNRDNLAPLYIWMIPGHIINNQTSVSISETKIHKWDEYRLDIDKVVACCDTMKDGKI